MEKLLNIQIELAYTCHKIDKYSDEVIFLSIIEYFKKMYRKSLLNVYNRQQKHLSLALPYRQLLLQEHYCETYELVKIQKRGQHSLVSLNMLQRN